MIGRAAIFDSYNCDLIGEPSYGGCVSCDHRSLRNAQLETCAQKREGYPVTERRVELEVNGIQVWSIATTDS
jgi:hypothetical protein